jgi:hypothetical protein
MAQGLEDMWAEYQSMIEECHDAMSVTPVQVLTERSETLISLIREVSASAAEEDMDQVEVLRDLEEALAQGQTGRGRQIGVIGEESSTIHYLYYTLTMMKCFRYVRDRCIQQAQVLDLVLGSVWQKGIPSQVVQQLKEQETPMVKRSKEAVRFKTRKVVAQAYDTVLATGEDLQRIVDLEGSSTASGQDQSEAEEDEDLGEDSEDEVSLSSSHHSKSSDQGSQAGSVGKSKGISSLKKSLVHTSPSKKSPVAKGKKVKTLEEVLSNVKYRSYKTMCSILSSLDMVGAVNLKVKLLFQSWMDSRMMGMREDTRDIAQRIVDEPINWMAYDKPSPGGKSELDLMDFEGRAKGLDCTTLWRQLEDMAAQYSWTVNARCSHLCMGTSLKGQAKEVIKQAKTSGDDVLNSATPHVGDIVACLLRYYQLKFRYLVLVGKPTPGAVLNKWMEEVLFETETAEGKLQSYQAIKRYHLMKNPSTARDLHNELARQAAKTDVGKSWWREVSQRLRVTEELQIELGKSWTLTHEAIQHAVEAIYNLELAEEQSTKSTKPSSRRGVVVNALRTDDTSSDRSRSSSPPDKGRGYQSRSQSDRSGKSYQDKGKDQRSGGSRYTSSGSGSSRGFTGRDGRTSKYSLKQCECCGCGHFEDVGHGKCPWRPTDTTGAPKLPDYNGWDLRYFMSKAPRPQRAMYYRILEMDTKHPAFMDKADRETFFVQVNGDQEEK